MGPKHADDVEERVGVAERRHIEQRLGARLGASGTGNVGELNGGGDALFRVEQRGELVQAIVRHARHPDTGLGLPTGSRCVTGAGQKLKKSRLT